MTKSRKLGVILFCLAELLLLLKKVGLGYVYCLVLLFRALHVHNRKLVLQNNS